MKLARLPDGEPEIFHTIQGEGRNTVGRTARAAAIGGLIDGSDGARTGAKVGLGASILTRGESLQVPAGTLLETQLRTPLDL